MTREIEVNSIEETEQIAAKLQHFLPHRMYLRLKAILVLEKQHLQGTCKRTRHYTYG